MWIPSEWRIVTSAGANVAVSTGAAILHLGGVIGAIYVAPLKGGTVHTFRFEVAGGGIGAGVPVSIAASTADFPGSGIGAIMARSAYVPVATTPPPASVKLHLRDLVGPCQIGVAELDAMGGGTSFAMILFNLDSLYVDPTEATDHCKAMGVYWGTSLGLQGGVSASVYRGNLRLI